MTKWFDANYHYVVPEIGALPERLVPLPWRTPLGGGDTAWAILGPYSLVKLSKLADGVDPAELAAAAGRALWAFVREERQRDPAFRLQVDEPSLGMAMTDDDRRLLDAAYADAADLGLAEPPLVTVQFGRPSAETVAALGRTRPRRPGPPRGRRRAVRHRCVAGAAGARHLRRGRPQRLERRLRPACARRSSPSPTTASRCAWCRPPASCSCRYTVVGEDLPPGFAVRAREGAPRWRSWAARVHRRSAPSMRRDRRRPSGRRSARFARAPAREEREGRPGGPRPAALPDHEHRVAAADDRGPAAPRAPRRAARSIAPAYEDEVDRMITEAVAWQEAAGIDVLVHGEFERTDMVEYFAEKLDGFHTTRNGWVLCYGSRCTRPPILAAPPVAHEPMTVREWRVAQAATDQPVKGMLTGPVTIVNWSFRPPGVPDDRLFWAVAQPIADEVRALVEAGRRIVQVDEPAVRERWPLPTVDAPRSGARSTPAACAPPSTTSSTRCPRSRCTRTCATATSATSCRSGPMPASTSRPSSSAARRTRATSGSSTSCSTTGTSRSAPACSTCTRRTRPGTETMASRLEHFRGFMDAGDLWVNPDCGLKTRSLAGDRAAADRHGRGGQGDPLGRCSSRSPD